MFKLSLHGTACKVMLFTSLSVFAVPVAAPQAQTNREVSGIVRDQHGAPVNKAVVQLENEDTHALITYIADADGAFHFKRVLSDTDYEVWATFQGKESKKHAVSKFNDKSSLSIKLIIEL